MAVTFARCRIGQALVLRGDRRRIERAAVLTNDLIVQVPQGAARRVHRTASLAVSDSVKGHGRRRPVVVGEQSHLDRGRRHSLWLVSLPWPNPGGNSDRGSRAGRPGPRRDEPVTAPSSAAVIPPPRRRAQNSPDSLLVTYRLVVAATLILLAERPPPDRDGRLCCPNLARLADLTLGNCPGPEHASRGMVGWCWPALALHPPIKKAFEPGGPPLHSSRQRRCILPGEGG